MSDTTIQKLVESFMRFPGIGPRQARRFVYYLLHAPSGITDQLLRQITELRRETSQCQTCFRFFNKSGERICDFCRDATRDGSLLMLVEKDIDLENINKSGTYHGHFFVLGGLIKILDKAPETSIRARELLRNIETRIKNNQPNNKADKLTEIIIAVSANQEGDTTIEFLKKYLAELSEKYQLKISTLGRGLSTGVELEYSDSETIKNALKHRETT